MDYTTRQPRSSTVFRGDVGRIDRQTRQAPTRRYLGAVPDVELVGEPLEGRVFERGRSVRLGDASPGGRLRLDALARYLQDVSNDDTRDAAMADDVTWVVRRIVVEVEQFPLLGEQLWLRTFCSAVGSRWAERRVSVAGSRGGRADAATLWVHVDGNGRPAPLPEGFLDVFGRSAGDRTVGVRLRLPGPPPDASVRPWPLRFTDYDVLGHVNNAAAWSAVEEVLADRRHLRAPLRAEVEFRSAIEARPAVELRIADDRAGGQGTSLWLTDGDTVFVSASVRRSGP